MTKVLHFSLGPVQGFVAQARRTRDFWVGSFLLSYLTGHAMQVVRDAGGEVIFPDIEDDPLMAAINSITRGRRPEEIPMVASLPNRFMAMVPADFDPSLCKKAVLKAWQDIAAAVYDRFILPAEGLGQNTRHIWNRQINGFWEMVWATGTDTRLLDRRKNWRVHIPTIELGDKCTLMGNLQELSGYTRSICQNERKKQDAFWAAVRKNTSYNIKPKERLCAISFVKRMFPEVSEKVLLCPVVESYPSTPSLAAAHWLEAMVTTKPDLCRTFAQKASRLGRNSERKLALVQRLESAYPQLSDFLNLDPNCFFASSLENDNLWEPNSDANAALRQEVKNALEQFETAPSPFYGLLLMDGDKMGALLSDNSEYAADISAALSSFCRRVPGIIDKHNGACVYAGGDDVLAMLPLEDTLPAALELQRAYRQAFQAIEKKNPNLLNIKQATISAAIIYAHQNVPLQIVIREAHSILDKVAKDGTGRNSLAIKVWKSSNPTLLWSAPWPVVEAALPILETGGAQFSNSFLHNIRRRFEFLKEGPEVFGAADIQKVLEAEYLKTIEHSSRQDEAVRARISKDIVSLIGICRRTINDNGTVQQTNRFRLDGALLVKFLSNKGVEN